MSGNVGAGFCPAGFAYAGFGTPAAAVSPGGVVFADPVTNQPLTGAKIDPTTGQFVINPATGLVYGMTTAQQLMYLALKTVRGSAAYAKLGQAFTAIQDVGPNIKAQITDEVTRATADIVASHYVAILSIDVQQPKPTRVDVFVRWVDLTTGIEETTPV